MSQLELGHTPEPDRPYYELQVEPNPELLAIGNYITQYVGASCAYCGEPLEIEEKIEGMQRITIRKDDGRHLEECDAYRRSRITLDDADGHIGRDVPSLPR